MCWSSSRTLLHMTFGHCDHTGSSYRKGQQVPVDRCVGESQQHWPCPMQIYINFTGADWGDKLVGVTKKKWITEYFRLGPDDPINDAFQRLGDGPLSSTVLLKDNFQ